MIRIFSILSALTILMMLTIGVGIFWLSQSDARLSKHEIAKTVANGLSQSVSSQVITLQKTLSKMAELAEVISAVESKNPVQIEQTSKMLGSVLPMAMKIRILPANISELDESSSPHMGNADLIMVQETLQKSQYPVIQGLGKNRHLAITAVIKNNDVSIGILLASLKFNFLQTTIKKLQFSEGYIELKQGNATLAKMGNSSFKSDLLNSLAVSQSSWKVLYWPDNTTDVKSIYSIASIIIIPILLTVLFFFISYRTITRILRQDQGTILKAVKDLLSGKTVGSYPVSLNEMKAIISTIIQFKRVLDNEGKEFSTESADREIDAFFDEPSGVNFMDAYLDADAANSGIQLSEVKGTPVSIPETNQENHSDQTVFSSDSLSSIAMQSTIFKANDIRGIAGKTLTKEIVFDIGRAIGSEVKEKNISRIVVGKDGRTSSPVLTESLIKGIISTGINVLDIGLVPSPVVYFVCHHTEGKSCVVITGSHNPTEYNGLKIIIDNETLAGEKIQKLKQRIENNDFISAQTGSVEQNKMYTNEYIGNVTESIHIVRPMKVVIDCGNGAASELAPILLKTLGCEVIELFCDIDGTFPNHPPDPSKPENLTDLITAVQHYEADVGIALDGDGDRLGVVDCKGKIIWPDRQMMLFAKDVLSLKPHAEIIYDVKCSRHLNEQIIKNGGRPLMWKTGHSFMKSKLKETGAAFAGEMSGHFFFNDRWFGFDDALYSASRLIQILSADTRNSDEVFLDFPDSINTPEINIELAEGENISFMEKLFAVAYFADGEIITLDGLRVEFSDGWGLVRASNTMPALVLRFEADNKDALKRIQSQFKEILTKIKPDLDLPF